MLVFKYVKKYRLFLEGQQLHVLDYDRTAVSLLEVSFHTVKDFTSQICRVMVADKCRAAGFYDGTWLL
jgi:hypothetical protein